MDKAGVHPSLIHAYHRTGRLVTWHSQNFFSPEERLQCQDAFDEWNDMHESRLQ
jgi:hypothetical protein